MPWYTYEAPPDPTALPRPNPVDFNLPILTEVNTPAIRLRHIGDSMTAFTLGQNGYAIDIETMPWFTRSAGMSDPGQQLIFFDAALGYGGAVLSEELPDELPPGTEYEGSGIVGAGDFKKGYSPNGFGNDIMEGIAPAGVSVETLCAAIGGTSSAYWVSKIPDYLGGTVTEPGDWEAFADALLDDAANLITPIVTFSIGANDMRDRIIYDGGIRMDNDPYWNGTDVSPIPVPNPEGYSTHPGWETVGKMGEIKSNIKEMLDYIHFLTGGNPTGSPITVDGITRPANTPGNVEIYIMSYPNWPVRNGDVEEWWPAGGLDREGMLSGLWVMDGVGCYADFLRDTDIVGGKGGVNPNPLTTHPDYRVRNPNGGGAGIPSVPAFPPTYPNPGELGPIPQVDQYDRWASSAARYLIADQYYRDYSHSWFDIDFGSALNRAHGQWTLVAVPNTNPFAMSGKLAIDHPEWKWTSPNGDHGSPGDPDYAPATMNGWDIGARSVNDTTVNQFFHGKLEPMYEAIVAEETAKYNTDQVLHYIPLWTYREEPTKGGIAAEWRPWPFEDMSDILHLNRQGAQHLIEGLFQGILQYTQVLRFPPQTESSCSAPAQVAAEPLEIAAAVPSPKGILGCCDTGYTVEIRTRGGHRKILDLTQGLQSLDWSRTLDDVSDAGVTITKNDGLLRDFHRLVETEPFAHELRIERDGFVVWEGPLTLVEEGYDTIRLAAFDVASWLEVRRVHDTLDYEASGYEAVGLALKIINSAMAEEDSVGLLPHIHSIIGTKSSYRKILQDDDIFAIEELYDLATELIDWTVAGRRLILMPDGHSLGTLRPLRSDHFIGGGYKIRRNASDYANVRIKKGNSFSVDTGETSERYGLVERVARDQGSLNQDAAREANEQYLARRTRVPTVVEMDDGAQLDCNAPVLINELIPGVEIPLDISKSIMAGKTIARLRAVNTRYDIEEAGNKESVTISLVETKLDEIVNPAKEDEAQ